MTNRLGRYEYIWLPTDAGDAIPIGLYKIFSAHLGTPRIITDETNTPVWQWPYSAFGESSPTCVVYKHFRPYDLKAWLYFNR